MPRRSRSSPSRSRISAWIVTSSAVVGSSATRILRIAGERERDHDPLPHAAGELVRVGIDTALGRGDMDEPKQLDGAGARSSA